MEQVRLNTGPLTIATVCSNEGREPIALLVQEQPGDLPSTEVLLTVADLRWLVQAAGPAVLTALQHELARQKEARRGNRKGT